MKHMKGWKVWNRILLMLATFSVLVAVPVLAGLNQIVVAPIVSNNNDLQSESGIVWTNPSIGYAFYVITSDAGLYYTKTTDGGTTWGTGVKVQTSADTTNRISNFNIWYDRWTRLGTGTRIHIAWLDAIAAQLR